MNIFLIDYENVHAGGLSGLNKLDNNDFVYIFYSAHANTMPFQTHVDIVQTRAQVLFEKTITNKKNDLDIQLSSFLGYLIQKNINIYCKYYIVSNDNEFKNLSVFWETQKAVVSIITTIEQAFSSLRSPTPSAQKNTLQLGNTKTSTPMNVATASLSSDILAICSKINISELHKKCGVKISEFGEIIEAVKKANTKVTLNNNLMKLYPNNGQKVSAIYQQLKNLV